MNCEGFNDKLYEYLDGSLTASHQRAAQEHIQRCEDCRRALQREEALSHGIRQALEHATSRLSLDAATALKVMRTRETEHTAPNSLLRAWQWFVASSVRPAGAGAALLVALLVALSIAPHREPEQNSPSVSVAALDGDGQVVDVPIQTQTRLFRRQDNQVLDAIYSSVAVGHARLTQNKSAGKTL